MKPGRTAPALLASLLAAACSSAPPPEPVIAHTAEPPAPPPPPPAPPLTPARWVESGGATLIGPRVGDATLVLLGGRRALVGADGAVKIERTPGPEPLLELIEVPLANGGTRLAGRGVHGLYRFEDPLGPPIALGQVEGELARLGAAPGVLVFWTSRSDLPRFVDVSTGGAATLSACPSRRCARWPSSTRRRARPSSRRRASP
ncbi:MAG: hypothetical protein U0359_40455 [Byssovorax sp.]